MVGFIHATTLIERKRVRKNGAPNHRVRFKRVATRFAMRSTLLVELPIYVNLAALWMSEYEYFSV